MNTQGTKLEANSSRTRGARLCRWFLAVLTVCSLASVAAAGAITFGGQITQSTQDGTGPAGNNIALNNIQDLQTFLVTLVFPGSITAPGTYAGTSLTFSDPAAPASETSFGSSSLTITANGGFDDFSLLGCLTTGSGCLVGNQLDASFRISAAMFNSLAVTATGLDLPHPLDLLEDDGTTDIQGTITTYSNSSAAAVPEASSLSLFGGGLGLLIGAHGVRRMHALKEHPRSF